MSQKVIDDVLTLTTPKAMMAAIDDNFDELYAADIANLAAAKNRANHTGTQLAATISDLAGVVEGYVAASPAVAANTAKVSNVTTNLSYTLTASSVTVVSSDGLDATIPAADTTLAGVMSAAMVTKLNTASASYTAPWI